MATLEELIAQAKQWCRAHDGHEPYKVSALDIVTDLSLLTPSTCSCSARAAEWLANRASTDGWSPPYADKLIAAFRARFAKEAPDA